MVRSLLLFIFLWTVQSKRYIGGSSGGLIGYSLNLLRTTANSKGKTKVSSSEKKRGVSRKAREHGLSANLVSSEQGSDSSDIANVENADINRVASSNADSTSTATMSTSVNVLPDEGAVPEDKGSMTMQLAFSAISLIANQFVTRVDFSNKRVRLVCRTVFLAYLILTQLLVFYLRHRIEAVNDESIVVQDTAPGFDMESLLKQVPGMGILSSFLPSMKATPKAGATGVTVREYDLAEANKLTFGLIGETLITLYMDLVAKMPYLLLLIPLVI